MKTQECFWIFGHLGLGDHIVCNALYRHYAELHKDKFVVMPIWEHNLAAVQWMLSDVPNIFFYPIETEQQLMQCRDSLQSYQALCLGFYETDFDRKERWRIKNDFRNKNKPMSSSDFLKQDDAFNPVLWDSEFYRQANLDPELKWKGFKLPPLIEMPGFKIGQLNVVHEDFDRGFAMKPEHHPIPAHFLGKHYKLAESASILSVADEIHCIDSSMLNLADLMETPYCKRFVFHRYSRKGLPPRLKKNWEIID